MNILKKIRYRLQGRHFIDPRRLKAHGKGCHFGLDCHIMFPERVELGDYVRVGSEAYWHAEGGIQVGRNVIFAPRTTISTANHDWRSEDCLPYSVEDILKPVIVEDNCWICLNAKLLPGVTIGEGAIVGMGAVVTKSVAPLAVVQGNPSQEVRQRDPRTYERLKAEGKALLIERAKQQGRPVSE